MIKNFEFEETGIEGLTVIYPFIAEDERGYFMKNYEREIFKEHGIILEVAEDFTTFSKKGVIRGLHIQTKYSQDKLVRVLRGRVFDVAVDLRKDSKTFGQWKSFYLSSENPMFLYIPRDFAHGFLALTEDVIFSYRCGQPYAPAYDGGILWCDKELAIDWPLGEVESVIISEKDSKLPTYKEFLNTIIGGSDQITFGV